jgi:hypothetical protein
MKSIFNAKDNAEFINRIDKLNSATPAQWGKMNVSQMLAHCQILIKMAQGDLKLNRVFLGLLFGNIAKKSILKDEPIKRNLPTFKKAVVKDQRNFEEEKAGLIALVKKLLKTGPNGLGENSHPFFGTLTPEEWGQLNTKHLDHHLAQFGV